MMSQRKLFGLLFVVLFPAGVAHSQGVESQDWLTWGGDPQRSGWVKSGSEINSSNVAGLGLAWKTQIEQNVPIEIESGASMLTAPLVVTDVATAQGNKDLVFTLSFANTLAALDAETGQIVWKQQFRDSTAPPRAANWLCTNTPTATPVIDKASSAIYFLTADGTLHGVSLSNGEDKIPPTAFVPPFSRNWSLNLVDGVLYTTVGRGCGAKPGGGLVSSQMTAMDLTDPARPVTRFGTSSARPSGVWGRAGLAWGPHGLYGQTADGPWDPAADQWGQTLVALEPKTLELLDYFTPANLDMINKLDLDFGSSGPLAFSFGDWELVAAAGKEGTIYLLDAKELGGEDHRTPLFELKVANDAYLYASMGVWGAMSTAVDASGDRWLYVPIWGPVSNNVSNLTYAHGLAPDGAIIALKLVMEEEKPALQPVWISRNLSKPEPPIIVNDVVIAISTGENSIQRHTDPRYLQIYQKDGQPLSTRGILSAQERGQNTANTVLYAFDAQTGKELFSSQELVNEWTHLSSVTTGAGKIYVTTRDATIHAFGPKQ
ncbi:MAG: PQQ-binding-like beta-propeller repeat protein [Acidobacteria bacterium]|nr:PQQ-binding-like beta-propeller repeat protein [Acidobacteriota bacterium]